jgi:anti-sigma B factor antagonist
VELKISQRVVGSTVVVAPSGEIDLASADRLRGGLVAAESNVDKGMVIDLRGVAFIDSTGIGELVACQRRCHGAGVDLAFVVPDGTIRKILHVTGMDAVFDMHHEESAAVASVTSDG